MQINVSYITANDIMEILGVGRSKAYEIVRVMNEELENAGYNIIKGVFCKHFLEKNAKYFWRMLHLQIGESCKASAGSYSASYIAIADHI